MHPIRWPAALTILVLGISLQYGALAIVDQAYSSYPSVRDFFLEWLPNIQFGFWGEVFFFGLIAAILIPLARTQAHQIPRIVAALGLFYGLRGIIQLLFPIGAPLDAVALTDRLTLWGFESHAYFPGGHIGIMTIMIYFSRASHRRWLVLGAVLFALGTALARTHYTVDSIVGALIGYAIAVWAERHWKT